MLTMEESKVCVVVQYNVAGLARWTGIGVVFRNGRSIMHPILEILRWSLCVLILYAAVFVREDEEGAVQNRLEDWWLRLMYKRDAEISRAARFIQGVARLTNGGFDSVLGKRLWSLQAVGVSICFSLSSAFLTVLVMAHIPRFARSVPTLRLLPLVIFLFGLGLLPFLAGRIWAFIVWTLAILKVLFASSGFIWFAVHTFGYAPVVRGVAVLSMMLVISFGFDVLYISITRWMLRRMFQLRRLHELLEFMVLDVVLAAALVYGPMELTKLMAVKSLLAGMILGSAVVVMFNFGDFIACSVFFIVMLTVLAHRLMWPILERPLYALHRYGVISNKTLLWSVGAALLVGPRGFSDLAKYAVQHLSG
jgi:hypothetical protein